MIHDLTDLKKMTIREIARLGQTLVQVNPLPSENLATIRQIGEILVRKGEPLLAFEILKAVPENFQSDQKVRHFLGLALARTGATQKAWEILDPLCAEQQATIITTEEEKKALEETLCSLARTYKDFGLPKKPGEAIRDHQALTKAKELYTTAHDLRGAYYPGINRVFVCQMLNLRDAAARSARAVYEHCLTLASDTSRPVEYWIYATMGEAAVTLGMEAEAKARYAEVAQHYRANETYGDMGSTVRQLRYLLSALGRNPAESATYLKMPRVAVFVGHMIDLPGRCAPRFPEALVDDVKKEIAAWLEREDIAVGYASAACGSDLLFLETLLAKGGKPRVILPFEASGFRKTSVKIEGMKTSRWSDSYDDIVERFAPEEASNSPLSFGDVAYDYANQLLHGAAIREADSLGTELRRLAIWDGGVGAGPGGTSAVLAQWLETTCDIDVITVPKVAPAQPIDSITTTNPTYHEMTTLPNAINLRAQVAALLFADVKGFSKLTEQQVPIFVEVFLGAVAKLLDTNYQGGTAKRNTWGDGLYVAFDSARAVADAGMFALDLADLMRETDWSTYELPKGLAIRTALHAGPVYVCTDPLTNRQNCIGTNVSHAARLEPSTPENQVYSSAQFAALSAALGVKEFSCRYIGHVDWAKGYGVFPTYLVERS